MVERQHGVDQRVAEQPQPDDGARQSDGTAADDGELVAVVNADGDVLAYVGSAGYYRDDLASAQFAPQHDAAAAGRQPGSAFKPIVYATAFDQRVLTPGSLLLDISTDFGGGWAPHDADQLERGPVLVRQAIQLSLNLPAIRALERVGNEAVADTAGRMGINFIGGRDAFLQAGLAGRHRHGGDAARSTSSARSGASATVAPTSRRG